MKVTNREARAASLLVTLLSYVMAAGEFMDTNAVAPANPAPTRLQARAQALVEVTVRMVRVLALGIFLYGAIVQFACAIPRA